MELINQRVPAWSGHMYLKKSIPCGTLTALLNRTHERAMGKAEEELFYQLCSHHVGICNKGTKYNVPYSLP
jgi:hypothetical protein